MPRTKNEFGRFFRNRRTVLGLNLSEFCRQNGFDKGNVTELERGDEKPPESSDLLPSLYNGLHSDPVRIRRIGRCSWDSRRSPRGKLPSAVSNERRRRRRDISTWAGGFTIRGSRPGS